MNTEEKQNKALTQILRRLPSKSASPALRHKVMMSFERFHSKQTKGLFSLPLLFGHQLNARALAMVSALVITLIGGVSGYAGAEYMSQNSGVIELFSQAFPTDILWTGPEAEA